ncbi:hypothetical protein PanWU01x14_163170 [Parasponia andersonii]|uniref:Uncharacterized protein n=1 Tax=Parasponia andersonii TaxID=3476 RepID=A0A2P5CD76_PARAD|nr:hypothetical protein PanWU01x14_163170 [Parasponia andersonii]
MSHTHSRATLFYLRSRMHAVSYACCRNLREPIITWYLSRARPHSVMRARRCSGLSRAWTHDIPRIVLVMVFLFGSSTYSEVYSGVPIDISVSLMSDYPF